jgi:hypothetical protein
MAPVYRPRQVVLTLAVATEEPASQIGRDVLAELADGRTLLRRLMPGADRTRFDLAAYNAPVLPLVAVRSALPVVGVLWPEAWGQADSQESPEGVNLMVDEKL